ncbi:phage tail tube protein [Aurantimonas endophytica]|uniref:Putative secreted protein n=1 Tax=Aurantimonas endophytica TaxID=1522175 RepID=A0A7W6MN73_9HYPH|nr:phage tail tube protein [Aurantimonas endophytica]MBB4001593.1 putative secreted protein [Aurantimonas endophytica]MCO6402767.1 phage tail protein [Aurantimonas endophytica]
MATEAMIGYLSTYAIHDGADPGVFTEIGEVTEITPGEESTDRVDVTHMQSPDRRREFISGLIDPGEASFTINWVPGSETDILLRELQASGDKRDHKITFPNGVTVTFEASVLTYSKSMPIDDRMTATITVAPSGAETWTEAA